MEAYVGWLQRVVMMLLSSLKGWTEEEVKDLAARQEEVRDFLRESRTPEGLRGMSTEAQIARWVLLYHVVFGIKLNPMTIRIPERPKGIDCLVMVAPGLTLAHILSVMTDLSMSATVSECLSKHKIRSIRSARSGAYAVWCRNGRQADQVNRGAAAIALNPKHLTLEERLLLGIAYKRENGCHLDNESPTLCGGSSIDGAALVPLVSSSSAGVQIVAYQAGDSNSGGALRSAFA